MDVYIVPFFKSTYLRTEGSSAFDLKVPKIYLVLPRCAVLGSITNSISKLLLVLAEEFC